MSIYAIKYNIAAYGGILIKDNDSKLLFQKEHIYVLLDITSVLHPAIIGWISLDCPDWTKDL